MEEKETRKIYIKLENIDNLQNTFIALCTGINTLLEYYYDKNNQEFKNMLFAITGYLGQLMMALGMKPEDYEDKDNLI